MKEYNLIQEKLLMNVKPVAIAQTPGEPFGYDTTFEETLAAIGPISPQEFARRYPSNAEYLPHISFDPKTAQFWDEFNLNPHKNNQNPNRKNIRFDNFRLNAKELDLFEKNGFVVSDRLGNSSFARAFFQIFRNDLPVFVSADALLHAWHKSYDAILEELEEYYLLPSLKTILERMAAQLPKVWKQYGGGIFRSNLLFADYFLTVARSLLAGRIIESKTNVKELNQRVIKTVEAIAARQLGTLNLRQRKRTIDFSQFEPRGHYQKSQRLQPYFRAMMWCSKIDFRIGGTPEETSLQELGAAIVLYDLLKKSGNFELWQQFDSFLQRFVGRVDGMTFAQLGNILEAGKIQTLADIPDLATLERLQAEILAGKLGTQQICADYAESPFGEEKIELPRSFAVIGQRFTLDSWVLSQVVFDRILWEKEKVRRFVPTCLDVAFGVFNNNQVVPELVERMTNETEHPWRDGLNYQHNLAAVREVVEAQNAAVWQDNIYMAWLATLRELSTPTTDAKYPEAMRTRAWAMKTLNSQLASWTQLRHDNVLYVKQSHGMVAVCEYPAGFVEPRIAFWECFEKMVLLAADAIAQIPWPNQGFEWIMGAYVKVKAKQIRFLQKFAQTLAVLRDIAIKQLAEQPLNLAETKFLRDLIEAEEKYGGSLQCTGWYPGLFYKGIWDADKWVAIVTDVHTNIPSPQLGNVGSVLHQGVGNVDMLVVAINNGEDKMVYAGPVLSHYEFEVSGVSRQPDSDWQDNLKAGRIPPRPDWTKDYLVQAEEWESFNR